MTKKSKLTARVKQEFKEEVKDFCEKNDFSLTGFIITACKEKMDSYEDPFEKLEERIEELEEEVKEDKPNEIG